MFSSITIASSTTKPVAIVSPISDRLSRLKPSRYIAPAVPRIASGTVTPGITVAGTSRRNTKITSTTRQPVRISVNSTSCTDARIVCVRSDSTLTLIACGIDARSRGIAATTRSTVSITLAPGSLRTATSTALLWPTLNSGATPVPAYAHAASLVFSAPSTARPMSRTRTGAPLCHATMTSSHTLAARIWSLS